MNKFYNICWQEFKINKAVFEDLVEHFSRTTEYLNNTLEHLILFCLIYILTCILMYILIVYRRLSYTRSIKNARNVMFVFSHPDDEVMFFGPTILHFVNKTDTNVYVMCLSTGYGMGNVRKRELYKSCGVLGIKEENIFIKTHTSMPDKIDVKWPCDIIEKLVLTQIEQLDVDVLITFDRYGISRHPNHCSIYFSVANLILENKLPKNCCVYVLETVNVIRKYWLILDIPITLLMSRVRYITNCKERKQIHQAMRQHKSQLVWFRLLYMYFSRYMLMNSLQQMNVSDVELDLAIDD